MEDHRRRYIWKKVNQRLTAVYVDSDSHSHIRPIANAFCKYDAILAKFASILTWVFPSKSAYTFQMFCSSSIHSRYCLLRLGKKWFRAHDTHLPWSTFREIHCYFYLPFYFNLEKQKINNHINIFSCFCCNFLTNFAGINSLHYYTGSLMI